ncbi:hypothetical protein ACFQ5N_03090 [Lutibacter holmesii]|uniref:Isoleucyl-tRNA synthetase n=1 Tax=Lutibacter holmesii TaxID=1137985 RepID=A0ABW3WKG0_9FLAO
MKSILIFLLVIIIGTLTYGFYIKETANGEGEIIIGICVLAIAFIFMPLFIYYRYKDKNLKDFTFDKYQKDLAAHNKKEESK